MERPFFIVAFVFALICSAMVLIARLTQVTPELRTIGPLVIVFSSILALLIYEFLEEGFGTSKRHGLWKTHILAGLGAIFLAHALLGIVVSCLPVHLVERPAQLVNDVVLTSSIFALVWGTRASRRGVRLAFILGALALVGCYANSAALWHLDPFHGTGVQGFVVMLVLANAFGLFVFDVVRPQLVQS